MLARISMRYSAFRVPTVVAFLLTVVLAGSVFAVDSDSAKGVARSGHAGTRVYIVRMTEDSVLGYRGGIAGYRSTRPERGQKLDARSAEVSAYASRLRSRHDAALGAIGVATVNKLHDYVYTFNGFAARMTEAEAEALARKPSILSVRPDTMRFKTTDSSPGFLGLSHRRGPWASGYTGEDVVVGVIDTGIWPEHPSFAPVYSELVCLQNGQEEQRKKNGACPGKTTETALERHYDPPSITLEDTSENPACNFGNTAANPADETFACNNKLIGARQVLQSYRSQIGADPDEFDSARDDDGHGTHTASTAAGNPGVQASLPGVPAGTVSGIAPRARVVAYKALGNLGGFTSDLAAAIEQAVVDGVDIINYSIGGGASLDEADDLAFLFAADAGVYAATSAGNSGPGDGTIGGPGSVPWIATVAASTQHRFFEGQVELSGGAKAKTYSGASITAATGGPLPLVDADDAGDALCAPGALNPALVDDKIVLCQRGAFARVAKSEAVFLAGGAGMILYNVDDEQSLNTDTHWVPSVHVDNTTGLAIQEYLASTPDPLANILTGETAKWKRAPSMAGFSSRGPNTVAEDIIKPDITAPGVQILAGASPYPDPGSVPGELFQAIAGTSMSSPHVAGVFALLKQAHPTWSPAMVKSALMTSADPKVKDSDLTSGADPFDMGAGHLEPGRVGRKGTPFAPGLVYDASFFDYLGFLCDAAPEFFSDPVATCSSLESSGIPTDASSLNYPSIGVADLLGTRTLQRRVTNVTDATVTFKAKVSEPPGYNMTVEPSVITLGPWDPSPPPDGDADTAIIQITIANDGSAPPGQWRFGSLTWKGGGYKVRSPIAVRAGLSGPQ